jgi:hypothetical protein
MQPFCYVILSWFCFASFASEIAKDEQSEGYLSELLLLDAALLLETKSNQKNFANDLAELIEQADKAINMQAVTVTQNETVALSGDPHDYFSVGPYWWPDPKKKDGLPWINRDGQVNQSMRGPDSDTKLFQKLMRAIRVLGLAYYFTERQKYAEKAQQLLQVWFLDADTKMNPHLNYAQSIPGRVHGRGIGIIDWRLMPHLLDALTLISPQTDDTFEQPMQEWLSYFLVWMIESKNGQDEAAKKNNHGTFYDVILASLTLYLKFDDLAKDVFANSKIRIASQINADGRQPHELDRTKPFHYSSFHLLAFTQLATMADKVDINLWHFPSEQDQRIYRAYRYLLDNIENKQLWQGKQESDLPLYRLVGSGFLMLTALDEQQNMPLFTSWGKKAKQQASQCALLFNHTISMAQTEPASFRLCNY